MSLEEEARAANAEFWQVPSRQEEVEVEAKEVGADRRMSEAEEEDEPTTTDGGDHTAGDSTDFGDRTEDDGSGNPAAKKKKKERKDRKPTVLANTNTKITKVSESGLPLEPADVAAGPLDPGGCSSSSYASFPVWRQAAPPSTLIDSLPGFDGALPFRLETGYVLPTARTHASSFASFIPPFAVAHQLLLVGRYVTVDEENGGELFYYFIESEGDPRRDPLLLWLPGGDRCTVLQALLLQLGPLRFVVEPYNGTTTVPRLHYHPYSWTKAASVLFLDSPVGAGFSFSRNPKGYDVGEVSSSLQVKTFLTKVTLGLVDMSYY
ncbi:hypothetical protein ACQ4PT_027801 [Festuca glaucescens]